MQFFELGLTFLIHNIIPPLPQYQFCHTYHNTNSATSAMQYPLHHTGVGSGKLGGGGGGGGVAVLAPAIFEEVGRPLAMYCYIYIFCLSVFLYICSEFIPVVWSDYCQTLSPLP